MEVLSGPNQVYLAKIDNRGNLLLFFKVMDQAITSFAWFLIGVISVELFLFYTSVRKRKIKLTFTIKK